jgi:hypothetical protein
MYIFLGFELISAYLDSVILTRGKVRIAELLIIYFFCQLWLITFSFGSKYSHFFLRKHPHSVRCPHGENILINYENICSAFEAVLTAAIHNAVYFSSYVQWLKFVTWFLRRKINEKILPSLV